MRLMRPKAYNPAPGVVAVGAPLPLPRTRFHGRVRELNDLLVRYQSCVETTAAGSNQPPGVLLVHGKVGVGKTALAVEFGRRVAEDLGHPVIFADIGHSSPELVVDAIRRKTVSSLRKQRPSRQVLVILDSVSEASEISKIVPPGSQCTLLAISRQVLDLLLDSNSLPIEVMSTDDAYPMLAEMADVDPLSAPECIAEILELCGRLPAALASVGERIGGSADRINSVTSRLRPAASRLDFIGGALADSIASQYDERSPLERRAFLYLSLVEAPTFASWVLRPLINIGIGEAETLTNELARAQLLEAGDVDGDGAGGFSRGRYRFHPLVKAYAKQKLASDEPVAESNAAQLRLNEACLEVCARALSALEPDLAATLERSAVPKWIPADCEWPGRMTLSVSDWVQADYRVITRAVLEAYEGSSWDICWRLGAYLEYSVPDGLRESDILGALDLSLDASKQVGSAVGLIRVLMARATVLTSFEHYDQAFDALEAAEGACDDLALTDMASFAGSLRAAIHVKRADAWRQLADYNKSSEEAECALALALTAADELQEDHATSLLRNLRAAMEFVGEAAEDVNPDPGEHSLFPRALAYDVLLRAAEAARRRRDTDAAESLLRQALRQNYGHARRAASVRYRLARLFLEQSDQETDGAPREHLMLQAVAFSAGALNNFNEMRNEIGQMRARCLLARSLTGAGSFDGAKRQLELVQRELHEPGSRQPLEFLKPINARYMLAQGERFHCTNNYSEARNKLSEALSSFGDLGDYWSYIATLRLLGMVHRQAGDYTAANANFWQLADLQAADSFGLNRALAELAMTALQMGHEATALELKACVGDRRVSTASRAAWSLLREAVGGRGHESCLAVRRRRPI
jgi:tetratricopeptide (TPR) repeat protein